LKPLACKGGRLHISSDRRLFSLWQAEGFGRSSRSPLPIPIQRKNSTDPKTHLLL